VKRTFTLALSATLAFSALAPSVSAHTSQEVEGNQNTSQQSENLSDALIDTVNPYIVVKDNKFQITNLEELKTKISSTELNEVRDQINYVNENLDKSDNVSKLDENTMEVTITDEELKSKAEKAGFDYDLGTESNVTSNITSVTSSLNTSDQFQTMAYKNGVNKLNWKWFGAEVWLSRTTVINIINAGISGGTIVLGVLFPAIGTVMLIALNAYIGSIYVGKNARACIVDVNWAGEPKNLRYQ
jgi:hypothetical protein